MEKAVVGSNTGELVQRLGDRLGIGKSKLYDLKKKLGIDFHKGDGEVWVTPDELTTLENGVEGQSHIVVAESLEIDSHAEEIQAETVSVEEDNYTDLIRSAQELSAGMAIARYQLASQIEEEDLPSDLREKVAAARNRVIPKSKSPEAIAKVLVQQAKSRMLVA